MFRHLGALCFALAAFTFGCDAGAQELTVMTIATGAHRRLSAGRRRLSAASSLPGATVHRHVARGEREHLRRAQPWRASPSTKRAGLA